MCKTSQDEMLLKDLFSTSCKYMLTCCVEPSTTETAETEAGRKIGQLVQDLTMHSAQY